MDGTEHGPAIGAKLMRPLGWDSARPLIAPSAPIGNAANALYPGNSERDM